MEPHLDAAQHRGLRYAEEAIRVARLGRELAKLAGQEDNTFVKLEVIPDSKHLLPDPIGTLQAAERLVKEGFTVLPYINADPLLAKRLEEVGCATVMPLGSPIGSGQGLNNAANINLIIENAGVPVVVDAGIGVPSEAAQALEMGADALLINSAIALAGNPGAMARAMAMACEAGRTAFHAGRLPCVAKQAPVPRRADASAHKGSAKRRFNSPLRPYCRLNHVPRRCRSQKRTAAGSMPLPKSPEWR